MPDGLNGYTWDSHWTYTARSGESWDLLANRFYNGNSPLAPIIIYANPHYADALTFEGGERLLIPKIRFSESDLLPPWKRRTRG